VRQAAPLRQASAQSLLALPAAEPRFAAAAPASSQPLLREPLGLASPRSRARLLRPAAGAECEIGSPRALPSRAVSPQPCGPSRGVSPEPSAATAKALALLRSYLPPLPAEVAALGGEKVPSGEAAAGCFEPPPGTRVAGAAAAAPDRGRISVPVEVPVAPSPATVVAVAPGPAPLPQSQQLLAAGSTRGAQPSQIFRRNLTQAEFTQLEALLASGGDLRQVAADEFGWALSVNGHVPGVPGRLDFPSALTAFRQLTYLNGLPALDMGATQWFFEAHAGGHSGDDCPAVVLEEFQAAVTHLLGAALVAERRHLSEMGLLNDCQ